MTEGDTTAEPAAEEQPWERNRRLRQAELEALNERGRELLNRHGGGVSRPTSAERKPTRWRRRR